MSRVHMAGVVSAGVKAPSAPSPDAAVQSTHRPIIYIDHLALTRDCISNQLAVLLPEHPVEVVCTLPASAIDAEGLGSACCVVYYSHSVPIEDAQITRDLGLIHSFVSGVPVVLLSDIEATDNIVSAMRRGMAAYIPCSLSLKVVSEALRLVIVGGTFVPASALPIANISEWPRSGDVVKPEPGTGGFTRRQHDVLRCLWEGRSNKDIAHTLRLSEGTVKVHIKHIMRKVRAVNRTQAVLITRQQMLGTDALLTGNAIPSAERLKNRVIPL
jgi:DNA-binding NarL/FixJ family response regulator